MASFALPTQESNYKIVPKYYPKSDLRKVSIAFSKGKKPSADYEYKLLAAEGRPGYTSVNLPN